MISLPVGMPPEAGPLVIVSSTSGVDLRDAKGFFSVDTGHDCGCSEREADFCWEHCLNRHQLNDAATNAKEKLMEIHESIAKDAATKLWTCDRRGRRPWAS